MLTPRSTLIRRVLRPLRAAAVTPPASYQLDLVTPGSRPWEASSRKQMRQTPNFRMYARGRPQILHRLTARVEYFGARFAFAIMLFLAIGPP